MTEAAIVAALIEQRTSRFEATVAAAAVIGALTAALLEWAADAGAESLGETVRAALAVLVPSAVR